MKGLIAADFISAIFLLIQMIGSYSRKGIKTHSSEVLFWVGFSAFISCLADGFCYIEYSPMVPDFIILLIWLISYSFGTVGLLVFIYYCYLSICERCNINKWFFYIPFIGLILDTVYILWEGIVGNIVYIENGIATVTGGMPVIGTAVQLFFIAYTIFVAFLFCKQIGIKAAILFSSLAFLPVVTSICTLVFGCRDYSYPACAISVCVIYALFDNRLALENEEKQKKTLLGKNNELAQRLNIIQSISSIYFASYYIDLRDDSFIELKSKANIHKIVKSKGKAQEALNMACDKLIETEYKDSMRKFFDLSTIQERLHNKTVISNRYVGVTSGWSNAYFIVGDRDENGKLNHVLYACRTIHDEKAREDEQNRRLEEYINIITNAGMGIWTIYIKPDTKPRLQINEKMGELMGVSGQELSEEEMYTWWYDRIVPEAYKSVEKSVDEMLNGQFSENTYLWNHPENGKVYVRCGGVGRVLPEGGYALSGYHIDVTHIVEQEELKRHAKELEENKKQMMKMNVNLLSALGTVVEFRSLESGEHVKRVMRFTKIILRKVKANYPIYGLTDNQIELMSQAAALHDIGKIGVPDEILKAPRKLSIEEFEEMKKHSILGCEILEKFKFDENEFYKYCYEITRWHHEKIDGKGYPDGLKGEEIPIYCQVTAIADCFDALVTQRVYKPAKTCDEAFDMILNGACGAFSDDVLNCFKLSKEELFKRVVKYQKIGE